MITLTDCIIDGVNSIVITHTENDKKAKFLLSGNSSYQLIKSLLSEEKGSLENELLKLCEYSAGFNSESISGHIPPLMPEDFTKVCVSAFGNTHMLINGQQAQQRNIDWYIKGHGNSVITNHDIIRFPLQGYGGGIEIEYALILMTDKEGRPRIIGYTLANDFSDVEMRHRYPHLSNFSKLTYTCICPTMVISEKIPDTSSVTCNIVDRNDNVRLSVEGLLGSKNMCYTTECLMKFLFSSETFLLPPFSVYYMLLGAAISSDKAGLELQHGDNIIASCNELTLTNVYEDEGVTLSCC